MIRRYKRSDRRAILDVTTHAFPGSSIDHNIEARYGQLGSTDWAERKSWAIERDLHRNPDGVFVSEEDGRVVGYVTCYVNTASSVGWVANIAVEPEFQGRGIGRALMDAALDYFRDGRMRYAKIETLVQNEVGQRLYTSLGFEEVARQIHYFKELQE